MSFFLLGSGNILFFNNLVIFTTHLVILRRIVKFYSLQIKKKHTKLIILNKQLKLISKCRHEENGLLLLTSVRTVNKQMIFHCQIHTWIINKYFVKLHFAIYLLFISVLSKCDHSDIISFLPQRANFLHSYSCLSFSFDTFLQRFLCCYSYFTLLF